MNIMSRNQGGQEIQNEYITIEATGIIFGCITSIIIMPCAAPCMIEGSPALRTFCGDLRIKEGFSACPPNQSLQNLSRYSNKSTTPGLESGVG